MPELASEEQIAALEAENARLAAAMERIHEGASRTAQDSRSRDDDRYCIADVIETSARALAGDGSALEARLREEHSKTIKTLAEAWRKVVPEFVLNLQIEHLMQPLEAPSTAAEKIRAAFDATLDAARQEGREEVRANYNVIVKGELARFEQERDSLRTQLAERDATIASLRNRIADNLCYLKPDEKLDPMLPKPVHLESCSRFYDQEVAIRGVLEGRMTVAQLEEKLAEAQRERDLHESVAKARQYLLDEIADHLHVTPFSIANIHVAIDRLAAQVERLRTVADDVVQGGGIADLEDARAVLSETPAASLAAVREQARREALEKAVALFPITNGVAELWTPQQIRTMLRELAAHPAGEPHLP